MASHIRLNQNACSFEQYHLYQLRTPDSRGRMMSCETSSLARTQSRTVAIRRDFNEVRISHPKPIQCLRSELSAPTARVNTQ